jgi:hypothetical protein
MLISAGRKYERFPSEGNRVTVGSASNKGAFDIANPNTSACQEAARQDRSCATRRLLHVAALYVASAVKLRTPIL